ncbi:MAG TPA: DUF3152 domain-containing protein [Actinoplanes sp.]
MSPRVEARARPRRFRHTRRRSPIRHLLVSAAVVAAVYLTGLATVVGLSRPGGETAPAQAAGVPAADGPQGFRSPRPTPVRTPSAEAKRITFPQRGAGTWSVAPGRTVVAGRSGALLRYRVAVEKGIRHLDVAAFAAEVSRTLADARGWTGAGRFRLQRVDATQPADFVVHLATPHTRGRLCGSADTYTSCRKGDRVVLNVARWVHGAPAFIGGLSSYRQYVVNHEVGHRLGMGHERCPGRGETAPVMQQQSLGLHGCRPGSWPLRDGTEYHGPAGAYDDPLPDDAT